MAKKSLSNFESLYADGEAKGRKRTFGPNDPAPPYGFRAQTVNGTAQATGLGWNQDYQWSEPEAREGGAWQPGRSNRTGE